VRGGNNIVGWRQIVENNDVTDPLGGGGVRGRGEGGVPIGGFEDSASRGPCGRTPDRRGHNKIYAVAEGLRSFPGTRLHRDREEAPEPGRGKSRPPTWREEGHTGGRGGVGLGIRTAPNPPIGAGKHTPQGEGPGGTKGIRVFEPIGIMEWVSDWGNGAR